jgi:aromatic ring-opening dioxygenase catalytic subunit (LigB family)
VTRQPALYIPHGGGPCFFMDDPRGLWGEMEAFLRSLPPRLPQQPSAILVISAHWETSGFCFTGVAEPDLIYDYYSFPPHTYELTYPAPGAPALAARAADLLRAAGLEASVDPERGFDHGVFIPLKVAFPQAHIPVVEMSLDQSLDAALHAKAGQALIALRDENVLIIGSGMSFHNMRAYGNPAFTAPSRQFDDWLAAAMALLPTQRSAQLALWDQAPGGRISHPREEHLLPAMVAAGAGDGAGQQIFSELVMETAISGYCFP